MSTIEFILLAGVFFACLSIVWSSLRCGITPVPSSRKARREIIRCLADLPDGPIVELGSGWGQLALALAEKFPDRQVIGYEVSPLPWLTTIILRYLRGVSNLSVYKTNFLTTRLPAKAIIVCYLYPGGMKKLAGKLAREEQWPQVLVSNTFALPGQEPDQTIRLQDLYRSPIYVYRWN